MFSSCSVFLLQVGVLVSSLHAQETTNYYVYTDADPDNFQLQGLGSYISPESYTTVNSTLAFIAPFSETIVEVIVTPILDAAATTTSTQTKYTLTPHSSINVNAALPSTSWYFLITDYKATSTSGRNTSIIVNSTTSSTTTGSDYSTPGTATSFPGVITSSISTGSSTGSIYTPETTNMNNSTGVSNPSNTTNTQPGPVVVKKNDSGLIAGVSVLAAALAVALGLLIFLTIRRKESKGKSYISDRKIHTEGY